MRAAQTLVLTAVFLAPLALSARADGYPISGRFGVSNWSERGPIDCAGLRVVGFSGEQRTDSGGGVPGYRNNWIRPGGDGRYNVSDWFTTGQVRNGQTFYELRIVDTDRVEIVQQRGGTLRLQRCK